MSMCIHGQEDETCSFGCTMKTKEELRLQNDKLQAELDKHKSQLENCTQLLDKHWPSSMGCNGHLQIAGHLGNILAELDKSKLLNEFYIRKSS